MDHQKTKLDQNLAQTTGIFTLKKIHAMINDENKQEQKNYRLALIISILALLALTLLAFTFLFQDSPDVIISSLTSTTIC